LITAELDRQKGAALHEALHADESRAEAFAILRGLIEQVAVSPRAGGGFEVDLVGEIAGMVETARGTAASATNANAALGRAAFDAVTRRTIKVVAGTGNHRELTLSCRI
jgi:hypothetical protein